MFLNISINLEIFIIKQNIMKINEEELVHLIKEEVVRALKESKSGIHIDKKNKGKFTATKKRTGKSTEELTHSKNPLTRKRAVFALNAKKWNHKK